MATQLSAPVDVQIELTQVCNWRCRHCYNYWRPAGATTKPSQHLSRNELLRIVKELVVNQVPSITITGGEPFSQREDVFALLKMTSEAGIRASINTNLSLVREEDVDRLVNGHNDVSLLFSLLSADATEHECLAGVVAGTHARVIEHAALAIRRGLSVSLNMVLMQGNLHALENTARLAKNLGVRAFCATKALPNVYAPNGAFLLSAEEVRWSLTELMRLERLLDMPVDILGCYPRCLFVDTDAYQRFSHRTCVAGYTTVTIGADGNVRACSHMETSYGNILREPLTDIWQKISGWREGSFVPKECRDCPVVSACRGGCRVSTLAPGLQNMDIYADPQRLKDISLARLAPRLPEKADEIPMRVMVHSQARFRSEAFGALIYIINPLALVLVNHSAATFLAAMAKKGEVLYFSAFLERSGAKTENERRSVEHLYRKLIRKGFLTTPTERRKGDDDNGRGNP